MSYSDELRERYRAIVAHRNALLVQLVEVLGRRAAERAAGEVADPALLSLTAELTRKANECMRDCLRLQADIIDEHLKSGTAPADPFGGLTVPDFMPDKL